MEFKNYAAPVPLPMWPMSKINLIHNDAISTTMLVAGSELAFGVDMGSILSVWLHASELPLAQVHWMMARNSNHVTLHAFSAAWEESAPHRSMACSKMEAHNFVFRLNCSGASAWFLQHKMQSAARTLLCEMEQTRDISRQIAKRTTKILRPISRHVNTTPHTSTFQV